MTGEWRPAPPPDTGPHRLTPAQAAILALVIRGFTDQQIADRYGKTPGNVRRHLQLAIEALGATGRAHAAALALTGRAHITVTDNRKRAA